MGLGQRLEPAQRATACSPGRVREPWVRRAAETQAHAVGDRALNQSRLRERNRTAVAHCVGSPPGLALPRARGLALGYTLSPTARAHLL